jgi:hypothetical protein
LLNNTRRPIFRASLRFQPSADLAKVGMPYLGNLLKSNGGIELAPEICLKIAEAVIELDPKNVLFLLLTSKVSE